jgi:hypothetical protein
MGEDVTEAPNMSIEGLRTYSSLFIPLVPNLSGHGRNQFVQALG